MCRFAWPHSHACLAPDVHPYRIHRHPRTCAPAHSRTRLVCPRRGLQRLQRTEYQTRAFAMCCVSLVSLFRARIVRAVASGVARGVGLQRRGLFVV